MNKRTVRGFLVVVCLVAGWKAEAATIHANNTNCTLTNAILSANMNTTVGGCEPGSPAGTDTIILEYDAVYSSADLVNSSLVVNAHAALPTITSSIKITAVTPKKIERSLGYGCDAAGTHSFRLFTVNNGTLELERIELRNGCVSLPDASSAWGGAILHQGSGGVTLRECTLDRNVVRSAGSNADGGAVKAVVLTVHRSKFTFNAAIGTAAYGGAVYCEKDLVADEETTFSDNYAESHGGVAEGGALAAFGTKTALIEDAVFDRNYVKSTDTATGGAVYLNATTGTIARVLFRANKAIAGAGKKAAGGGLALSGTLSVLTSCAFENNEAHAGGNGSDAHGGGMYAEADIHEMSDTTFSGNLASGYGSVAGGGLHLREAKTVASMRNLTFDGNTATGTVVGAGAGGGMFVRETTVQKLSHVTMTGNIATSGHGIYMESGSVRADNLLLAGRTGRDCEAATAGIFQTAGHNFMRVHARCDLVDLQGDRTLDTSDADHLGPLQDNGCDAAHRLPTGACVPTIALLSTATKVLDKGGTGALFDARGAARPHDYAANDNATGQTGSDPGAFERADNVAPAIASLATHTCREDQLDCRIFGTATAVNSDGPHFHGGTLEITLAPSTNHALVILAHQDPAFARIERIGDEVKYGGVKIGVVESAHPLKVRFEHAGVSVDAVTALLRAIAFTTSSDHPVSPVSATAVLVDGQGTVFGGHDSASHALSITIDQVNDAPSFTAGAHVSVDEDHGAYHEPWATNLNAVEPGQTVHFTATHTNAALFSAAPEITTSGALKFTPALNAHGSSTVTVRIHDTGGTANGGVDVSPPHELTITVHPVNDAPSLHNLGNAVRPEFIPGSVAVQLDPDVEVRDPELQAADHWHGAKVEIHRKDGAHTSDEFEHPSSAKATFEKTAGKLTLTFHATTTTAEASAILREVRYRNNAKAAPERVTLEYRIAGGTQIDQGSGGEKHGTPGELPVDIAFVNDPPSIRNVDGGTRTYAEAAAAIRVANSDGTVTDPDEKPEFSGGRLTASIADAVAGQDILSIHNEGDGAGQIGYIHGTAGGEVKHGGQKIGIATIAAGSVEVVFDTVHATPAAIDALLRAITYRSGHAPKTPRVVTFRFHDGDGSAHGGNPSSTPVSVTINVAAENDAPELAGLGGPEAVEYHHQDEEAATLDSDSDATLADPELDAHHWGGAVLTVKRQHGANLTDRFGFTAAGLALMSGATPSATHTESGGVLTVRFTAHCTPEHADAILRAITYHRADAVPSPYLTIEFEIDDGNSGAQGTGGARRHTGTALVKPRVRVATTTSIDLVAPSASVVGGEVKVSVSVASDGTPTGQVLVGFEDGDEAGCTITLSADRAGGNCTLFPRKAGERNIVANYLGSASHQGDADVAAHTVEKAETSLAVTASGSVANHPVTVFVTVSPAPTGTGIPAVAVSAGPGKSCNAPLTNGSGNCTLHGLTAGSWDITATFDGSQNHKPRTKTITHTTQKVASAAFIISHLPDFSLVHQNVVVHVRVTSATATPAGNVVVRDDSRPAVQCTATLADGAGQCTLTPNEIGTWSLTARYEGSETHLASTSTPPSVHDVRSAGAKPTAVAITGRAPLSTTFGSPVTVSYSVTTTAGGTPTGQVTVRDEGGGSCTGTVAAGSCELISAGGGVRKLFATYHGTSEFAASISGTHLHTVNPAATVTTVSSSPNPSVAGHLVTVAVAVTSDAGIPAGTVTVTGGPGVPSCTAPLGVTGAGACHMLFPHAGTHTLTAVYTPTASFATSTGTATHAVEPVTPAETETTIASSPNPSIPGQPVTVSVAVTSAEGVPGGTVTITPSSGAPSCTAPLGITGTGSCRMLFGAAGTYTLTAVYTATEHFASSSETATQIVSTVPAAATSITVSSSPNPSIPGQPVTVSVGVTSAGGIPAGTVTITPNNGASSCIAPLGVTGTGTCSMVFPSAGTYTLTAVYTATEAFASSTETTTQVVNALPAAATAITLSSSPNPSTPGQPVNVSVAVTSAAGVPNGTVTITPSSGASSCTAPLNVSGAGTCSMVFPSSGTYTLTAVYTGNGSFATSSETAMQIVSTVPPAATDITLSSSPNPSTPGQLVTVSVSVSSIAGIPDGTVKITPSSGAPSCTAPLGVAGTGSCSMVFPHAGTFTLTAVYTPTARFASSTRTATHTVNPVSPAATEITLSSSPNPSTPGQSVTVSVGVTSAAGVPDGTVTIAPNSGAPSCTAPLGVAGIGSCRMVFPSAGTYTLTATYTPTERFASSTKTATHIVSTVAPAATETTLSSSPNPSAPGELVKVSVGVTSPAGIPDGTVTVRPSSGAASCTAPLGVTGIGACYMVFPAGGTLTLTAVYTPTPAFATSTKTATHTVSGTPPSGGGGTARRRGDVNGNGMVTAADASLVLQFRAGTLTLTEEEKCAADFNGANGITALDAADILVCAATQCSTSSCK